VILSGAKASGKVLGCSEKTVRNMVRTGRLPAFRTGSNTSPIRVERKTLAEMKKG
jgi:excisionase family DNA binding protein